MLGMGFPLLQNGATLARKPHGAGACKPRQDAQAGAGAAQGHPRRSRPGLMSGWATADRTRRLPQGAPRSWGKEKTLT